MIAMKRDLSEDEVKGGGGEGEGEGEGEKKCYNYQRPIRSSQREQRVPGEKKSDSRESQERCKKILGRTKKKFTNEDSRF